MESAQAKNQALREVGAVVPTSYEALESAIKETFEKLVSIIGFLDQTNAVLTLTIFSDTSFAEYLIEFS